MNSPRIHPFIRALCLVLALALAATACGSSDSDDPVTATNDEEAEAEAAAQAEEAAQAEAEAAAQAEAEEAEAEPLVKLDVEPTTKIEYWDLSDGKTTFSVASVCGRVAEFGLNPPDEETDEDPSADTATDEDSTAEETLVEFIDIGLPASVVRSALGLCGNLTAASALGFVDCDNDEFTAGVRYYGNDDDIGELVMTGHMMVRLHPADQFDDSGLGPVYQPTQSGAVTGQAPVVVIDFDLHGGHATSIIGDMSGAGNRVIDATSSMTKENIASAVGTLIEGEVTYLTVSSFATEPFLVVQESEVVKALGAIADVLAANPSDDVVINLSMGGYNCGDTPMELQQAMEVLINDFGVRFTVSAGNDEYDGVLWPAEFAKTYPDNVYVVGSTENPDDSTENPDGSTDIADDPDTIVRSCFSNHQQNSEYFWLVGEEVVASATGGTWSGTSFAAPQLAAMLATGFAPQTSDPLQVQPQDPDPATLVTYRLVGSYKGSAYVISDSDSQEITVTSSCTGEYAPDPRIWKEVPPTN